MGTIADRKRRSSAKSVLAFAYPAIFTQGLYAGSAAGALYQISEAMRPDLRYKALSVDYEDGTRGQSGYSSYDTATLGPLDASVSYRFDVVTGRGTVGRCPKPLG